MFVVAFFMVVFALPGHLSIASQHFVPSHLVSIRVFDVEPAYHVGSRLDFGYIDPSSSAAIPNNSSAEPIATK